MRHNRKKRLLSVTLSAAMLLALCACAESAADMTALHVSPSGSDQSGDGSIAAPFETPEYAVQQLQPGQSVVLHAGEYAPFAVEEISGTETAPIEICAAQGERAVILGSDEMPAVEVTDSEYITLRGLEICGGDIGIFIHSTQEHADTPLNQITVDRCTVHGIRGTHGICVYAENDRAPICDFCMTNCEVYDCECGDSETTVLNGNVDGFEISGNRIYDSNNIGIDMIGFEGTAAGENGYTADFVRNGKCFDNVVYRISSEGNEAYRNGGGYDLCAGGIYIDGGQEIEVYHNFVFDCDIGIEVATERCAADDPLFRTAGISVHDNLICGCTGFAGIVFGGYDADRGFTEQCSFCSNTLIDNVVQLSVQRSRGNLIEGNLFVGAVGLEYNESCPMSEMENHFGENLWCTDGDEIAAMLTGQRFAQERAAVLSELQSIVSDFGADYVPAPEDAALYQKNR